MGRLASILAKANDAVASVEHAVEQDVVEIIDRTKDVHKLREQTKLQKLMQLDGQISDLKEFARDLEEDLRKNDTGASDGNAYAGTSPPKL